MQHFYGWAPAKHHHTIPTQHLILIMPRLGDDHEEETRPLSRRQAASAYPGGSNTRISLVYAGLLLMFIFWILPNFLFRVSSCW